MSEVGVSERTNRESRWFISAPADVDLGPLIAELRRRGAEPYVLSDVAELGASLIQSVGQAIAGADYVLVVLANGAGSSNVFFEAGLAVGLGKSVLVVAEPGTSLPPDLGSLLIVRARPDDLGAITFALDLIEKRSAPLIQAAPPTGRALGSRADEPLHRLSDTSEITERDIIGILIQAIEQSGALAVESADPDRRFDLGVWTDDLDAVAANPLLIEVKRSLEPGAARQAMAALAASPNARVALLVYVDERATPRAAVHDFHFPILAISLRDLLQRMRTLSFAEVVRDLRNRSVHGLPL